MTNRIPLMAGNWKMNLDHLEANHLVQGLAMALKDDDHDYAKCEVLVIPPFTDIRTVQTIVDADGLDMLEQQAQQYVDFGFIDALPDVKSHVMDCTR